MLGPKCGPRQGLGLGLAWAQAEAQAEDQLGLRLLPKQCAGLGFAISKCQQYFLRLLLLLLLMLVLRKPLSLLMLQLLFNMLTLLCRCARDVQP